jgi:hypothetical protein
LAKATKRAKIQEQPSGRKAVPVYIGHPTFQGGYISWRFHAADKEGPWAWPPESNALARILAKLPSFEIIDHNSGLQDVRSIVARASLEPEAQRRLKELGRDDVEQLYGWHISGRERLWCIEYNTGMMCVLWWDQNHTVLKTEKRHT